VELTGIWGAPRIHGELIKLGIDVSQATVAKYMGQKAKVTLSNLEHLPLSFAKSRSGSSSTT
jgi:hypothetical protein